MPNSVINETVKVSNRIEVIVRCQNVITVTIICKAN
jgi:hypothetical protein